MDLSNFSSEIAPSIIIDTFNLVIENLDDYSTDQRGDIGSWVRMSCVSALVSISGVLLSALTSPEQLGEYLRPETFHVAIGGMLKQGVERLDNVRQLAGEELAKLLCLTKSLSDEFSAWKLHGMDLLEPLLTG